MSRLFEGEGDLVAQCLGPEELLVREEEAEGWTSHRIERALFEQSINCPSIQAGPGQLLAWRPRMACVAYEAETADEMDACLRMHVGIFTP
jgi:hypothetical protein